jgi:hypothetical protein
MSIEGSVVGANWKSDLINAGATEYKKLEPQLETAYNQLKKDFPDYNIVMSGHSLGGGMAQTFALKHNLDVQTLDSLPVPRALFKDGTVTQADLDRYKAAGHQVDAMYTSMDIATFWYKTTLGGVYLSQETGQHDTMLPGTNMPTPLRWGLAPVTAPIMAIEHGGARAADAVVGLSLDERTGKFLLPDHPQAFATIPHGVRAQLAYLNPSPIVGVRADQADPQHPSFTVSHKDGREQWIGIDLERNRAIVQQGEAHGYQDMSMRADGHGDITVVRHGLRGEVLSTTVRRPDGHNDYAEAGLRADDRLAISPAPVTGYDPSHPAHGHHALYAALKECIPYASDDRLAQFTAACHVKGITGDNLSRAIPVEAMNQVWFERSWPPGPFAKIDLTAPIPTPQQMHEQVQTHDQRQTVEPSRSALTEMIQ